MECTSVECNDVPENAELTSSAAVTLLCIDGKVSTGQRHLAALVVGALRSTPLLLVSLHPSPRTLSDQRAQPTQSRQHGPQTLQRTDSGEEASSRRQNRQAVSNEQAWPPAERPTDESHTMTTPSDRAPSDRSHANLISPLSVRCSLQIHSSEAQSRLSFGVRLGALRSHFATTMTDTAPPSQPAPLVKHHSERSHSRSNSTSQQQAAPVSGGVPASSPSPPPTAHCPHVSSLLNLNLIRQRFRSRTFQKAFVADQLECCDCNVHFPKDHLWACLQCTNVDCARCGRHDQHHASKHYKAEKHALAIHLHTRVIWLALYAHSTHGLLIRALW